MNPRVQSLAERLELFSALRSVTEELACSIRSDSPKDVETLHRAQMDLVRKIGVLEAPVFRGEVPGPDELRYLARIESMVQEIAGMNDFIRYETDKKKRKIQQELDRGKTGREGYDRYRAVCSSTTPDIS